MPAPKRKKAASPAKSSKREAIPGPDGKTLGQRVHEAMALESGRRNADYTQAMLVVDVAALTGKKTNDEIHNLQAAISAIMVNRVTESKLSLFIANACRVDGIWLSTGMGQKLPKR